MKKIIKFITLFILWYLGLLVFSMLTIICLHIIYSFIFWDISILTSMFSHPVTWFMFRVEAALSIPAAYAITKTF